MEQSLPWRAWAALCAALAKALEHRRLFVLLPFGMIGGLTLYAAMPEEPALWALISLAACGLLLIVVSLFAQSLVALRLSTQIGAVIVGFLLLPLHGALFGTQMLFSPAYGTYEARVDEIISNDGADVRVVVSAITPMEGSRGLGIRRARLLLPVEPSLQPGDTIRAALRFAPVPGPILPGAHDGQFHAYFSGIGSYGSATGTVERIAEGDEGDLGRRVQAIRDFIGNRIASVLTGDTASIGKAMVVGDQSTISDETRETMAASGLAHIYSISGLHLSIVAGGVYWLVRLALASIPASVAWPVKKLSAIAGLVAAFGYLLLAGGMDNVPAFRSTLMLALVFGAILAGRQALTMRNVAIAAIAIVLIDPASVFRPSFQLSFAAVIGLIGFYELPRSTPRGSPGSIQRVSRFVLATALTSAIAGVATLLFSAYHFQQTAPLGVLGNVLALPFVSLVIMPFGVLSVLAMPFGADPPFIAMMGWGIDRMIDVSNLVAAWSTGLTGNPLLAQWTLLAALIALGWFAFANSPWRFLGPAVIAPIILLFGADARPDVLVSDTTQAVAVRTASGMALVTGRTNSFAVDVWSDHFQTEIAPMHPDARCDALGCIATAQNYSVAVVRNAAAFAEDCGNHDLLVTRLYPPGDCGTASLVIGASQLASGGVHWLRWQKDAGRFEIRPAIPNLSRPWRVGRR